MHDTESINRRNIEAAIVGCMAFSAEAADLAVAELDGSEFSHVDLRVMFRAVRRMSQHGTAIDCLTLADDLVSAGEYETSGGSVTLGEVLDAVPHAAHVRYYCQQLVELHQRDSLRTAAELAVLKVTDLTCDTDEIAAKLLSDVEAIRAGAAKTSEFITTSQALHEYDQRQSNPEAVIPTGIRDLDRTLNEGFRAGQLVVVGGRPGTGKSSLMAQMIMRAAKHNRPGLFISLEMTGAEHAERALRSMSRQQFCGIPIEFSEAYDFQKLVSHIRLAKRRRNIEIAAVDYLQLIVGTQNKNETRERHIAAMSGALKRLAMELRIPILLGSQLNRESEKRGRPSLADLRESGAIEQDADIVILIAGSTDDHQRELIVAKHRGGPCGLIHVEFDAPRFLFTDPTSDDWSPNL